jgi:predicted kinase
VEAVIFSGLQATGKSTFYEQRFKDTHVRVSLDILGTRAREAALLKSLIAAKKPFVVDNTNVTQDQRRVYIELARNGGYKVTSYYFYGELKDILRRNQQRSGKGAVPKGGIFGTRKRLQVPVKDEGFDELFTVSIQPDGQFKVEKQI